jgi:hypothetical protein
MGNTLFYGRNTKNTVEVKPVQVQNDGLEPVKEVPVIEVVAAPATPVVAPATPVVTPVVAPATPVATPIVTPVAAAEVAPQTNGIQDMSLDNGRDGAQVAVKEKVLVIKEPVKESDSAASSATPSTATSPALYSTLDKEMVDAIVKQMNVIDLTESAPSSKKRSKKNRN